MKNDPDILIIGAGVCGLSAGAQLAAKGKRVTILEARNRTGGRVHNLPGKFGNILQGGPEFIHGSLPLTKKLIKKAGGHIFEPAGNMYRSQDGKIFPVTDVAPGMKIFMKQLKSLEQDTDLEDFLKTYFNGDQYTELRKDVTLMAEGFDAADPAKISVKSLYSEWNGDAIDASAIIKESYSLLVKELTEQCIHNGCDILLLKEVKNIVWKNKQVSVLCADGSSYAAEQIIVTLPLGVLTSEVNEKGHILFEPAIPEKIKAAKDMGYGPVVKVLVEFKSRFWDDARFKDAVQQINDLGFLFNAGDFPTLWFSEKNEIPLITAWAGGGRAKRLEQLSDEELKSKALLTLSSALLCSEEFIKTQSAGLTVFNWAKDEFAKGAYSYETPQTKSVKLVLSEPLGNTLYFAGEALGETSGTVEAALESAELVLKQILK